MKVKNVAEEEQTRERRCKQEKEDVEKIKLTFFGRRMVSVERDDRAPQPQLHDAKKKKKRTEQRLKEA